MLSGKFVVRVPPSLHRTLKQEALSRGESLNTVCNRRLSVDGGNEHLQIFSLSRIIDEFAPLGVIVFGSWVRQETTEKSDIDLLIVLPETETVDRDLYKRWDKLELNPKLSPQFAHLPDMESPLGSLWLEIALEGEILFEQNKIMQGCCRQIRSQIAAGKYQRKESHGQGYWVQRTKNAE